MSGQIIHEEADLVLWIGTSQRFDVILELVGVDRPLENHVMFEAVFFGYATQQCHGRLIDPVDVDSHVVILQGPF